MTTFEVQFTTKEQRQYLKDAPFVSLVERLDNIYTNIECLDERADDVENLLVSMKLEYRLV